MDVDYLAMDIREIEREISNLDTKIAECSKQEELRRKDLLNARSDSERKSKHDELDRIAHQRSKYERERADISRQLQMCYKRQRERAKAQADKAIKIQQARSVAAAAGAAFVRANTSKRQVQQTPNHTHNKKHILSTALVLLFFLGIVSMVFSSVDNKNQVESPATTDATLSVTNEAVEDVETVSDNTTVPSPTQTLLPSTSISKRLDELNMVEWLGRPYGDVISEFGTDYQSEWFGGAYFYYEDSCPFNFFYDVSDFPNGPSNLEEPIIAISSGITGAQVTQGISIGDSLADVQTALGMEITPIIGEGDELQLPSFFTETDDMEFFWYFDELKQTLVYVNIFFENED